MCIWGHLTSGFLLIPNLDRYTPHSCPSADAGGFGKTRTLLAGASVLLFLLSFSTSSLPNTEHKHDGQRKWTVLHEPSVLQTLWNNWKFRVPLSVGDSTFGQAFRAISTFVCSLLMFLAAQQVCTQGRVMCAGYSPEEQIISSPSSLILPTEPVGAPCRAAHDGQQAVLLKSSPKSIGKETLCNEKN